MKRCDQQKRFAECQLRLVPCAHLKGFGPKGFSFGFPKPQTDRATNQTGPQPVPGLCRCFIQLDLGLGRSLGKEKAWILRWLIKSVSNAQCCLGECSHLCKQSGTYGLIWAKGPIHVITLSLSQNQAFGSEKASAPLGLPSPTRKNTQSGVAQS